MIDFKNKLEEYTEAEFLLFLQDLYTNNTGLQGDAFGEYLDRLVKHFELVAEHPEKSGVIYYPKEGREDSPEGVLKEVKEWRARNNKPGFKSS